MDQLRPVEDSLAKLFKAAPQMSASSRKSLASWMPSLAIVFGVLQLIAAFWLWQAGHAVNRLLDYANSFCSAYGTCSTRVTHLSVIWYLALLVLVLSAVTLLMAYPGLKAHKKAGWNWLFLGSLINLVYGLVSVFVEGGAGGGLSRLFGAVIGSAVGFYLLFQIRDIYSGKASGTPAVKPKA